jgi:hypothetical protein
VDKKKVGDVPPQAEAVASWIDSAQGNTKCYFVCKKNL